MKFQVAQIVPITEAEGPGRRYAEADEKVDIEATKTVLADADLGRSITERTRQAAEEELRQGLKKQAKQKSAKLQEQVTQRLEGRLADLRPELDQAINRVTAEAL